METTLVRPDLVPELREPWSSGELWADLVHLSKVESTLRAPLWWTPYGYYLLRTEREWLF